MGHALNSTLAVVVADNCISSHDSVQIGIYVVLVILVNTGSGDAACKVVIKYGLLFPDIVYYLVLVTVRIVEILYVLTTIFIIGLLRQGGGKTAALMLVIRLLCLRIQSRSLPLVR